MSNTQPYYGSDSEFKSAVYRKYIFRNEVPLRCAGSFLGAKTCNMHLWRLKINSLEHRLWSIEMTRLRFPNCTIWPWQFDKAALHLLCRHCDTPGYRDEAQKYLYRRMLLSPNEYPLAPSELEIRRLEGYRAGSWRSIPRLDVLQTSIHGYLSSANSTSLVTQTAQSTHGAPLLTPQRLQQHYQPFHPILPYPTSGGSSSTASSTSSYAPFSIAEEHPQQQHPSYEEYLAQHGDQIVRPGAPFNAPPRPTVRRRALPTDCPICHDTLLNDGELLDKLTWCKTGCGNSMHLECFEYWRCAFLAKENNNEDDIKCVICRTNWEPLCEADLTVFPEGYSRVWEELGIERCLEEDEHDDIGQYEEEDRNFDLETRELEWYRELDGGNEGVGMLATRLESNKLRSIPFHARESSEM